MKLSTLFIALFTLSSISAFAGTTFRGVVKHENLSGSCHSYNTYEENAVLKAMIELAKASAKASADWRFLYSNGAVRKSEFTVDCVQEGLMATITVEAEFVRKLGH